MANVITMFKLVWHGDHELRLEWDSDQYIRTNAVSITDDDDVVQEAAQVLINQYFAEMRGDDWPLFHNPERNE